MLIPRAAVAREILPEAVAGARRRRAGVTAYRTVLPEVEADRVKDHEEAGAPRADLRQFVDGAQFRRALGSREEMRRLTGGVVVACIGPSRRRRREEGATGDDHGGREHDSCAGGSIVQYFSTCPEGVPVRCEGSGSFTYSTRRFVWFR